LETRIQILAILASAGLLLVVLELVRSKRLLERYALLWIFSALVLLALACSKSLLERVSDTIGVFYPPTALFLVAFLFVMVLLLHFSIAVSRLQDQSKVLAQRMALLEERQRAAELGEPLSAAPQQTVDEHDQPAHPAVHSDR
jgi:hypothetical protein